MTAILKVDQIQNEAGTTVLRPAQMQHRVIQRATYNHRGGYWTPENTYYWAPGAYIDFTPKRSDSRIRWSGSIPYRQNAYNAHGISHWRFYIDEIELNRHSTAGHHYEQAASSEYDVPSWGAGDSKRMGYMIRSYSSGSHNIHTFLTEYWDGGGASYSITGRLSVEEYVTTKKINTAQQPHSQTGCTASARRNDGAGGAASAISDGLGDKFELGLGFGFHSTTGVQSFPAYCAIYMGDDYPDGVVLNQMLIHVHSNSFGNFTVEGSNDSGKAAGFYNSGSWTQIGSGNAGGSGSGYHDRQALDFQFANSTAYKAYRIKITDTYNPGNTGTASTGWACYGIDFYGY